MYVSIISQINKQVFSIQTSEKDWFDGCYCHLSDRITSKKAEKGWYASALKNEVKKLLFILFLLKPTTIAAAVQKKVHTAFRLFFNPIIIGR